MPVVESIFFIGEFECTDDETDVRGCQRLSNVVLQNLPVHRVFMEPGCVLSLDLEDVFNVIEKQYLVMMPHSLADRVRLDCDNFHGGFPVDQVLEAPYKILDTFP